VQLHIIWQNRYANDLIRPLVRGVIRDAVSQYGIEDVYSGKRNELSQGVTDTLAQSLTKNGLVLQQFVLRDITFSPEYAKSVEDKQIAQQQAEQAKYVVESKVQEAEQARQIAQGKADAVVIASKGDAQARLIQADAEAKALNLIADALKDKPELLNYQYITKLSPNLQVMMLPANTPFLLPFPGQGTTYGPATPTATPESVQPTPTAQPTLDATQPTPEPTKAP
jgi:regulator of protease activity HflC (stomatin/prohibitin superfamily)